MAAERTLAYLAAVPVERVKGIGPARAKKLGELGIESVADLLLHVPRRYLDRSQLFDLSNVPLGEEVTIGGVVSSLNKRHLSRKRVMTRATITDGTAAVNVVWFNPYLRISEGAEVVLSGKVELFRGNLQMKSPDLATLGSEDSLLIARIVPMHPSVARLGPAKVRTAIDNALRRSRPIAETVPEDIVARYGFVSRDRAIADVHFPETKEDAQRARERLIFDELFRLELALALRKQQQIAASRGVAHRGDGALVGSFLAGLPFELTRAQRKAIDEIQQDLIAPAAMHRLLQGEVGSGKTVVALSALLTAVEGGHQGAIMAPTEVLAVQHYLGTVAALEDAGLAPEPEAAGGAGGTVSLFASGRTNHEDRTVRVALLTANVSEVNFRPRAGRSDVLAWIAGGLIDIVVGTHSLIQEGVDFHRLGVAVVDEQHRFGVYQRVRLREKSEGYDPDLLIMTATPIPRTLSMTLYGDLEVSLLDEMPPGRSPVKTTLVSKKPAQLRGVYDTIRSEAAAGRQTFVVCPLVEDSDKLAAKSATAEYERLLQIFPDLRLGLLHGQLPPRDKDAVMHEFRAGSIDVLVATTVIEVGIDVPNATVMLIEDADRFGLSQLHQLRGRVGRGPDPATCVLVAEPTTPEGEQRIAAMVETTDGFRLAEEDLRIRGQGTVFGTRQAGVKDLKLADILRDVETLILARREAFSLVAADPGLEHHGELAEELRLLLGDDVAWLSRS
jgi:ATP-dependent DNA helicase RecG